jgi:hypothetical protein
MQTPQITTNFNQSNNQFRNVNYYSIKIQYNTSYIPISEYTPQGSNLTGPRRSPERPFSGNWLEDLEDYARMNGILGFGYDPDWPGYVDEDFWEQFLSVYPEYEPYARQWFESHGQHFPLDPYADPILDLPIGLFVVLMIGYCFYLERKTVSV